MPICYPHVVNTPADRSQLLFLLATMMLDFWILVIVLSLQLVEVVGSNSAQSFFSLNAPRYKDNSDARWNSLNSARLSYDAGLFSPLEDFSSLSETEFTTFGHPAFPRHNIRIKKTPRDFCDDTAKFVAFTFVVLSRQSVLNENLAFFNWKWLHGVHRH
jgi:hypothetical protein